MSDILAAKRPAFIYGLIDPSTQELKYVGKADSPKERLKAHIASARRNAHSPKDLWLNSLGEPPVLVILGTCSEEAWPEIETRWIALARDMNESLTNTRDGGESGPCSRDSMERARYEVQIERLKAELGESLAADFMVYADSEIFGFPTAPDALERLSIAMIDRLSDAGRAAVGLRCLAKASKLRGGADSKWALSRWQPVPQYYPHEIRTDIFGQKVTPGLPPLRLTARRSSRVQVSL